MIRATITFYKKNITTNYYGGYSAKSWVASKHEFNDCQHLDNYIAFMQRKGHNIDELYLLDDASNAAYDAWQEKNSSSTQ